jgi:A/G-specific adenine glycosylase
MPWPTSEHLLAPLAPWFEAGRRDLPWRAADLDAPHPDPYAVLVSELMLQQTQVTTVIPYFTRWMARWPTAAALARASEDEVHKAWEGLGYYRRARLLHGAAKRVAEEGWPADLAGLRGMPGLGAYTAAAVAAQSFQLPEPALDGNAFRVLARLLGLGGDPKAQAACLRQWLRPALVAHGPSRMTQALMELGATLCAPAPKCRACPVASNCAAHALDSTDRIPPVVKRPRPVEADLWLIALESGNRWLVHRPATGGLLAGLWRWPTVPLPEAMPGPPQNSAAEPESLYTALTMTAWPGWTQVYTHRRERVHPVRLRWPPDCHAPRDMAWVSAAELDGLPMGRRDLRMKALALEAGEGPLPAPGPLAAGVAKLLQPA